MTRILLLFAASLSACAVLPAQTTAEITGLVTDTTNAVVPGSTVTIVSTGRQTERQTKSNAQGYYRLTNLEPGNYQVSVESPGFRVAMRTGLKLDVNQSLRLDFALEVGQVSETVEVGGYPVWIETALLMRPPLPHLS